MNMASKELKIEKKQGLEVQFPNGTDEKDMREGLTRLRFDADTESVAVILFTFPQDAVVSDFCAGQLIVLCAELSESKKGLMVRRGKERYRVMHDMNDIVEFIQEVKANPKEWRY